LGRLCCANAPRAKATPDSSAADLIASRASLRADSTRRHPASVSTNSMRGLIQGFAGLADAFS
jgi:hypothetical protein